jgi:hypothetical protein
MEAVRTSETSVNFNVTTRRYIPEDSVLQIFSITNIKWLMVLWEIIVVYFENHTIPINEELLIVKTDGKKNYNWSLQGLKNLVYL